MAAADPALGLSGAMAARDRPQMTAEPMGAGELSRAARSLESVQGNVAGQTMAIQGLSMTTQSAVTNFSAQMNALGSQIASLNSSIARLGGGLSMAAAPMTMPSPAYGGGAGFPSAPGVGSGFAMSNLAPMAAGFGTTAMRGAGAAFGGMQTVGTGIGYMTGAAMAPIFGSAGATRTSYGAELSPQTGLFSSMMIGSGLGVSNQDMRGMHYSRVREAGAEKFGDKMGGMAQGMVTGGMKFGADMAGAAFASRVLLPALGYSGSGIVGGLAGGIIGSGLAAPVTMAIGEVADQASSIKRFGDQYKRNAYRMGTQKAGRSERNAFGSSALSLSIEDLSLTGQDVSDITAGMFSGDLTRGVRDARGASDRLRSLSQSVKEMARTFGGSYAEMTQTASELQALGVTANTQSLRQATLSSAGVFGATASQGLQAGMAGARMFAGMGLGSQGFGIGTASANLANYATQTGAMNANTLAAVGGREGAANVMNQAAANFLRGPAGMALAFGGLGAGGQFNMANTSGLGTSDLLARGSQQATRENMLRMFVRPQDAQQAMAEDPNALLAAQAGQSIDAARVVYGKYGKDKLSQDEFASVYGQMTGLQGPELQAAIDQIRNAPEALKESQKKVMKEASDQMLSGMMERRSATGRMGRYVSRSLQPYGESLALAGAGVAAASERALEDVSDSLWNSKKTALVGKADLDSIRAIQENITAGKGENDFAAMVNQNKRSRQRTATKEEKVQGELDLREKLARDPRAKSKVNELAAKIRAESDPETKTELANELLSSLGKFYDDIPMEGPGSEKRSAIQDALTRITGVSIEDALNGVNQRGSVVTEEQKKQVARDVSGIRDKIAEGQTMYEWMTSKSVSEADIERIVSSDKANEYFRAVASGSQEAVIGALENMTDEEKAVVQAAEKVDGARDRINKKVKQQSAEENIKAAGLAYSDVFRKAGLSAAGMTGDASMIVASLGALEVNKENIDKLKKEKVSDEVIKSLSIDTGKIEGNEAQYIKDLLGDERAKEFLDRGELSQKDLGAIRAQAISMDRKGMTVTGASGGGDVSQEQAAMMLQAAQQYTKLAEQVNLLADRVAQLQGN